MESKDPLRVQISGVKNGKRCGEIWESIVKQNNEANGSFEFDIYFTNVQTYGLLVNEYMFVRAALTKLQFDVDRELIGILKRKGFKIVLMKGGTQEERNAKYAESLLACFRKSDNLITKTTVKKNEIEELTKNQQQDVKTNFDSVMANLSFHWPGSNLDDNITLARYNECVKLVREKQRLQKQHHGRS